LSSTEAVVPDALPRPGRLTELGVVAVRFALPAAMLTAVVGVFVATSRFGIGLTPDSVTYVQGARGIAGGGGYTDPFHSAIGLFPPGYSAVLGLAEWLGIDALDAARWLSAGAFAITVWLAWVLLGRHVHAPRIRAAATFLVGCSAVLLEIYAKLLSEHLFIPVVLAFILAGEKLLERPHANTWFAAAVVLAWAGFYLRYAGVVLLVIGGLVVLIAGWSDGRGRALVRSVVFVFAALSLPVVWMIRNQRTTGNPMGPRAESSATALGNVRRVADELAEWTATRLTPALLRLPLFVAVVVALGLVVVWLWPRGARRPRDWPAMVPVTVFIVVYVIYLIGSASVVAFAAIDTRFMVPVYVPLVVFGAWAFERIKGRLPTPRLRAFATVLGVIWIIANGLWFTGRAISYSRNGAGGYATERFQDSHILQDADRLDLTTLTVSNDPFAMSVLLDKNVRLSVAARYFNSNSKATQLPAFLETIACAKHARLIWFEPNDRAYLYTPEELQGSLVLTPIVTRRDGAIYDVRPRPGVTPECPT
jgi:hypothetical protein